VVSEIWTGRIFNPESETTIPKSKKRRRHSPDLKAKVGLEALKGVEPVHAIAARYEVHPVQVS
jgi:transposase-like protein